MLATLLLLLVEKDPVVQIDLEETLKDAGFLIWDVANGRQALAELEEDATRFSGLITSVQLGDGPNGWQVARRARQLVPDMPVVYVSSGQAAEWSSEGVPNSVMIEKPFAAAQVAAAIPRRLHLVAASSLPSVVSNCRP
jgi:DNA-binding response OmpR family regulator